MSNTIKVPFNSPAFESYVHEGWRQIYVDGLWATLRFDQDRHKPRDTSRIEREGAAEKHETMAKEDAG